MVIKELLKSKTNNKIAIKYGRTQLTYLEWNNYSDNISKIIDQNISKNSRTVAIFLSNSINYAIAYFGIIFSNKVVVPIGIQAKSPEIINTIKYCEIDFVITDAIHKKYIIDCLRFSENKVKICVIDSFEVITLNQKKEYITKTDDLVYANSNDDVAIMLHTSGTTNNPKRVMLTHKNLISNIESNIESLQLKENDKTLISLPMFFGYCNTAQFLTHVYLGATIVILGDIFWAKQFFSIVQNERITNFTAVPSMLLMILKYKYSWKYDISSLKYICFGGGNMPKEQLEELIKKFPSVGFVQTYGQTECSPRVTALLPKDSLRKCGSVGKPLPNIEVDIVDEKNNRMSHMQIGEIVVKGNNVMKGYFKQPKITNETIKKGWLHTGDIGYFDEEGYLYIAGRIKNIIISGGINIYPEEIEQILLENDSIKDAYVFSRSHELLGEVPVAKIVLNRYLSEAELKEYCKDKLAYYKIPIAFEVVDNIVKTYNGKIKRLREN